ncbi:MAG: hypothetical protein KAR40_13575 [Candidatus Sabulitectum sp.]|nr:hypothetical protein [Candidatus Sabulitectum sp.]
MKFLAAFILIAFLAGCSDSADVPDSDIAPREEYLTLTVSDTIGVELGDSVYMFGAIETLIYDANGNIAVLDMVASNLRIFSPAGEHIRTIGRRGNAPGEFQRPMGMVLLGNDLLAVMDPAGEGLTGIDPDYSQTGVLLDIHSNVHLGMCAVDSSDMVALRIVESSPDNPGFPIMVGRYSMSKDPSVIYWQQQYSLASMEDLAVAVRDFFNLYWTADRNTGDVYIAPYENNRYLVYRYSPEGVLLNTIELDIEQIPLTEREIEDEAVYLRARLTALNGRDMGIDIEPYADRRSITGLGVSEDGNLWVRRGTHNDAVLDLWTAEGELIQSYIVPGASLSWEFSFCPEGILAYDDNPDYFQRIFIISME